MAKKSSFAFADNEPPLKRASKKKLTEQAAEAESIAQTPQRGGKAKASRVKRGLVPGKKKVGVTRTKPHGMTDVEFAAEVIGQIENL